MTSRKTVGARWNAICRVVPLETRRSRDFLKWPGKGPFSICPSLARKGSPPFLDVNCRPNSSRIVSSLLPAQKGWSL